MYNFPDKKEVLNKLEKLSQETEDALQQEYVDGDKITKLLFEQMLQGLYLQNIQ